MKGSEEPVLSSAVRALLARGKESTTGAAFLIQGDRVLAEPQARALAASLASQIGAEVVSTVRPASLAPILDDLQTFSLFASGKVVLIVDSGVLADKGAAAAFLDEAAERLPLKNPDLGESDRRAAASLFQALRLFDLDPTVGRPEELLDRFPDWVFAGGPKRKRKRSKRDMSTLREQLVPLLAAGRESGVSGFADAEVARLSDAAADRLPPNHFLVLAESTVDRAHPFARALEAKKQALFLGQPTMSRDGWQGLDALVQTLAEETSVGIERNGLAELARRTLRQEGDGGFGKSSHAAANSTSRFAGEYRKLAQLAKGLDRTSIQLDLVQDAVDDRGQEDVWQILDAVGTGKAEQALQRLERYLGGAEDLMSARLGFFGLLASFCRHLTAIAGMMIVGRIAPGERNYSRFKAVTAPALQGEPAPGVANPISRLHPFRLHKAYLCASRIPREILAQLPQKVFETELRLKGEGSEPEAALAELILHLAGPRNQGR